MKPGKTLVELAAELQRQKETKRDFRAPTAALTLESNGVSHMSLGNAGSFEVRDVAHEQLAQHTGIPKKYYDTLRADAPKLLDANVNHWLKANNDQRLVRTLDGKMRAFLSSKYRPLDNFDLAEHVLPVLMSTGCNVESCEVTESRLLIKAVTPRIQTDIAVGDTVQAGICISNSEIGKGRLTIEPLVFKLRCLNGMIVNDAAIPKNHVGRGNDSLDDIQEFYRDSTRQLDDKAFWAKVQDSVQFALSAAGFEKYASMFRAAIDDKIENDPFEVMEVFADRYTLNDSEKKGVLSELIKSNDLTRHGLIDAVTAYAQTVESYDRSTELERLGGSIIELKKTDWHEIAVN